MEKGIHIFEKEINSILPIRLGFGPVFYPMDLELKVNC
jgi:hypothetical protein